MIPARPWLQRAAPDLAAWRPPQPWRPGEPLEDRPWLVVGIFGAFDPPERFGLGAFRLVAGGLVLDAGLIVPDDLAPAEREELAAWCAEHPTDLATGVRPPRLLGRTEFCAGPLRRTVITGRGWLVGADLGRTLALLADHLTEAAPTRHHGRPSAWAGGWTFYLPGLSVKSVDADGRERWRPMTGLPAIRARAAGEHGVRIGLGAPARSFEGEPRGARDGRGRPLAGRFLDVIGAADALDAEEIGSLADHLAAWGLPAVADRYALPASPEGADAAWGHVEAVTALAGRLGREGRRWAGGIDLGRLVSAAGIGTHVLGAMGVTPPLKKFALPDEEHAAWWRTFSAGRCESNLPGRRFPGVDVDLRSAYPAVAALIGWWAVMTAERVDAADATDEARRLVNDALRPGLSPAERVGPVLAAGLVRCVVAAQGQPFPVSTPGPDGQPSLALRPVWADHLDVPLADAVGASLLAGHPVDVLAATALVPVGRQPGLRAVTVPGLGRHRQRLDPAVDPLLALVQLRTAAKATGDRRLARLLRLTLNSTVFGQPARVDVGPGGVEVPGPWGFIPLAATVTAGARLLLTTLQAGVEAYGGVFAYCDTDGGLIPCAVDGGMLPDGRRILARAELEEILAGFDALDPFADGRPVWEIKACGPAVAFGQKRWACDDQAGLHYTLTGLGDCVPPPDRPDWAELGVRALLESAGDEFPPRPDPAVAAWPVLHRQAARTPKALVQLPDALGCRPFSRTIQMQGFVNGPAVALDPGPAVPPEGAWYTSHQPQPAVVSGDGMGVADWGRRAVVWRPLSQQLGRFGHVAEPGEEDDRSPIRLLRELRRLVGSDVGRYRDGSPQRVVADLDVAGLLFRGAQLLGSRRLSLITGLPARTCEAIAAGRRPRGDTIARIDGDALVALAQLLGDGPRACPGCGAAVAGRRRWCSDGCRKRSARSAARSQKTCTACGAGFSGRGRRCPACRTARYRCAGTPWGCSARVPARGGWCPECDAGLCVACRNLPADSPGQLCEPCWIETLPECNFPGCSTRFVSRVPGETKCGDHSTAISVGAW